MLAASHPARSREDFWRQLRGEVEQAPGRRSGPGPADGARTRASWFAAGWTRRWRCIETRRSGGPMRVVAAAWRAAGCLWL